MLAFAVTFTLLLLEVSLRRGQTRDQEMRQARLVWVEAGGMSTSGAATHVEVEVRPKVHNDSDETIRDVVVKVYDEHGKHLGDISSTPVVISPHAEAACYLRVAVPGDRDLGNRTTSADLLFTDAAGRRWKKGKDQALERVLQG